MRPLRSLLLAFAALLVLAAPAGAAKTPGLKPVSGPLKAQIGIADQKAAIFSDRRFTALRLGTVRRSVAWDALRFDWQIADVDEWMAAARGAGVSPVITFARSRIDARRHTPPTVKQMRAAFVAFRRRYPWVTDYVASNESNHFGEPTGRRPKLAAQYYKAMRRVCPRCRVAGATLLDFPNQVKWARSFIKAAGEQPRYWAVHNYISANRFDATRTRELLHAVKGELWLTEVGGLVKRRTKPSPGKAKLKEGVSHAAKVTRYIFDHLARLSPRIKRVYLYHWDSGGPTSSWDSALIGFDNRPRPAMKVLQSVLEQMRAGKAPKSGKAPKTGKPPKAGGPGKGEAPKQGKAGVPVVKGTIPAR